MSGKRKFEQYYPFVIPLLLVLFYIYWTPFSPNNLIVRKLPDLLSISLTLSGIALGFLGTMISAVLSITNSTVMRFIYAQNADKLMIQYIRDAAVVNLLVLLFSIVLLISTCAVTNGWILYLWLFTFCSSFFCSFRIIRLLFTLLEAVNNENRAKLQARKIYTPDSSQLKPPNE